MIDLKPEILKTDVLVLGGGAAGCMAAIEARRLAPEHEVLVLEKADVVRSGCLAAGLNAINAYLFPGDTAETFVTSARRDNHGLVREDLVHGIGEGVNDATHLVESWGMEIVRTPEGKALEKGPRSVQIRGEALKPLLAEKLYASGAKVRNRVAVTNLIVHDGRVRGAYGVDVRSGKILVVAAGAVICATGGAAGLYPPRAAGVMTSRTWYCPYNVGSGYAVGLRAGAELTTLEMRFIPTRVRHVQAPTGTLVQAYGAKQVNALGEDYARVRYGFGAARRPTLPQRLDAMLGEIRAGRGPVYLELSHLSDDDLDRLARGYLDMSPALLLYVASERAKGGPLRLEMGTSGPYLLGGHAQAGYWVDVDRRTTLPGLYAAGDVAGGAPKKYVSGAWVEARMAAATAVRELVPAELPAGDFWKDEVRRVLLPLRRHLLGKDGISIDDALLRLQRIMDEYAGGPSTLFDLHLARLVVARAELAAMGTHLEGLSAEHPHDVMRAQEVVDRWEVARVLVEHLIARDERRWPGYQNRVDLPSEPDPAAPLYFLVSRLEGEAGAGGGRPVVLERRAHGGETALRFAWGGGAR